MEIRAIAPEDEPLYRELLVSLTDRDRFVRFFHTIAAIGPTGVLPFVRSRPDVVGLIAVENGKALGAAHGFIDVERSTAEFDIEVRPDYRHREARRRDPLVQQRRLRRNRVENVDGIVRMSDFKTNEYASLIGGADFEPVEDNPMLGFRRMPRASNSNAPL